MKLKKVSTKDHKKKVLKKKKVDTPATKKYNSLEDVVDKKRPYSMLFSGVENDSYFQILYDRGIRNFLISYHYIQKKHLSTKKYEDMGIKFFIDSGAFTYMSNPEYSEYTVEQWEEQIPRYLNWIEKHRSVVFAFANLDLEFLVGGDVVQRWNEEYFEPFMLRTGIPVCFVHHGEDSKFTWEQYCKRYPYVGMSWGGVSQQDNSLQLGIEHLKVAEKYDTLVHGMAMTNTSLLTKLPFYTTDSTTWLVGLQYGEVNYWTGTKMSRLKKDKWKGPMLSNLTSMGFDEQKLLDEDNEELIKVNVQAFINAEQYVQDKLKSRMYWLRAKEVKRSNLDDVEYPSPEWCLAEESQDNWEEYAKSFNVSLEDKVTAINCITDITALMHYSDPAYSEVISSIYTPELIKELHNTWVNRIVESDEERISDLQKFFTEVLLGNETKLLLLGTNFDKIVKERDEYVEDTEYEYVDVPPMELDNKMQKYLPLKDTDAVGDDNSAPEISELDDEIFAEEEIVPIRDEKGRLIKGQKKVHKPKQIYSKKFPKLACDTCFNAAKCPEYKAGYACAYSKLFDKFDTRDMADIIQAMQGIVNFSLGRLQRGMLTEMLSGGMPSGEVSQLMNQSMGYLGQLKQMYEHGSSEVLRQTKIIREDGTQEMTTQVTNPKSGGILEKIFGGMGSTSEDAKQEEAKSEVKDDNTIEQDSPKEG